MDALRGFACCFAPFLALVLGLVAMATLRSARAEEGEQRERLEKHGRRLRTFALALLATAFVGLGVTCAPHVVPQLWIPTLERTSAPIVDAVEHYTRDHGRPPQQAGELFPDYLSAWPDSGYPRQDKVSYECYESSPGAYTWSLRVWTGIGLEDDSSLVWSSRTREWSGSTW
ncbi:MAG: hypothetical protein IPJ77_04210 [Planctomycetes bacterium]|nr:hypothetical protein [Planctomycetota bacterium]